MAGLWSANLFASGNVQESRVTIDTGYQRFLIATANISMIDSTTDFDRDNAISADILYIDGNRWWYVYGGDHFGDAGAVRNHHLSTWAGYARYITFRLRTFHTDAAAVSTNNVIAP